MKILLVDDSPAIIDIYGDLLREEGYELVTATSAIGALQVAKREKPDIGIIDYYLPDGNGVALTQSLLGQSDTAHILISLFSEVDHLRAALDAGAIDMISKQDPKDLFLLRVRALVRQVEQWHYQQTMQNIAAANEERPIRLLLADDSRSIRQAYAALLEDSGYEVVTVTGVNEGVAKAFEFKPELAIIDFHMTDGNGDELIRHLLADGRTNDVMCFVITGSKDIDIIERSLAAGAIDVLYKSDPQVVFLNRVKSMARYIRSQRHKFQLVEQLFQHIPVAMVEVVGRHVVQANPGFQSIFEFEPNPFMECPLLLRKMALSAEGLIQLEQELNGGEGVKSWEFTSRKGGVKYLELTVTTLPGDQQRQLSRKLLSISDVTALTNLHKAEEQAQQAHMQEEWLSTILSSIPDGILVVDHEAVIQQSNPAAEEMLGYTAEELLGEELDSLFEKAQRERAAYVDRYLRRKDGSIVPISFTAVRLADSNHYWNGWVVVLHNVEELVSAESMRQASKAKDEFLASMSHELRTPLTTIIGNSEMLAESGLSAEQQDLLHAIDLSSRRQLALVNDILDLSKIDSGKFEINRIAYDLEFLIEEIELIFFAQSRGSRVDFRVVREVEFEMQLLGDPQRIGQVLINLLGNAFKFTSEGEIQLRIWREEEQLNFSVIDQGIGMSEEVLARLFRPFEQADGSISRRFGGTGLGLHISKVLSGLMGGDISVNSIEGEGAEFSLHIPLQISDQPVEQRQQGHKIPAPRLAGRVLIAEDTPEIQMLLRRILSKTGVQVEIANNGREAVDRVLAQSQPFDLLLMDMQMPEMDGIEATEMLRNLGNETPIVALTANVMQKHREQFEAAGCNGFLHKPIDRQALFTALGQYLQSDGEATVEIDDDSWIDPELNELFLVRTAVLRDELRQHLSAESWKDVRAAAHTIKGSGATFGYPELGDLGHSICDALDTGRHEDAPDLLEELLKELQRVLEKDSNITE